MRIRSLGGRRDPSNGAMPATAAGQEADLYERRACRDQ